MRTLHLAFFAKIVGSTSLLACLLAVAAPSHAQVRNNDVGLAIQFGNSTNFGIQGKIGVANGFSLRPELFFSSTPGVESKQITIPTALITPFDYTLPKSYQLPAIPVGSASIGNGILNVPLTLSQNFTLPTAFTVNVPLVVGGNTIAAGTVIPAGTVVPTGTVLPAGLSIASVGLPAGTVIPAGTLVPANTVIPEGTVVPSGSITSRASGTSFGLAATYDFNLDREGKSVAYIGPKVSFASASGPAVYQGSDIPGSNINVDETKIGLVLGADYAVSEDFVVGGNLTYNFSQNVSGSARLGNNAANVSNFIQSNGSSVDLVLRAGFRF